MSIEDNAERRTGPTIVVTTPTGERKEFVLPKDPGLSKSSSFYRNCVRNRRQGCVICGDCPFRSLIEQYEKDDKIKNRRA